MQSGGAESHIKGVCAAKPNPVELWEQQLSAAPGSLGKLSPLSTSSLHKDYIKLM